jgi:hypothetical protein
MVGEIRDLETAQISIQASLTGHLVLSTLHTNDAAGAVTRLVDMGVESFLIAASLEAVLAQVNDLRSFRFLFLPAEHDPDSYIREHGAEAFDKMVEAATPLSSQLIDRASEGADLDTPEGRARMLAQARPLWSQLPIGALRLSERLDGMSPETGEVPKAFHL